MIRLSGWYQRPNRYTPYGGPIHPVSAGEDVTLSSGRDEIPVTDITILDRSNGAPKLTQSSGS
jgi:hypothetical protein